MFGDLSDPVEGSPQFVGFGEVLQIFAHERVHGGAPLQRPDAGPTQQVVIHTQGQISHGFSVARIPCKKIISLGWTGQRQWIT